VESVSELGCVTEEGNWDIGDVEGEWCNSVWELVTWIGIGESVPRLLWSRASVSRTGAMARGGLEVSDEMVEPSSEARGSRCWDGCGAAIATGWAPTSSSRGSVGVADGKVGE
jgi:hypothetical protein